ncbi:MAG: alpha/beta fold hydrolase [Betaproteobacteria bacterium]
MRVAFGDAAGIRTRYLESGAGEALFLVHGVGASSDNFAQNLRALGARLRVIAPDLMGHGGSAAGLATAPAPHVQMARQILALADTLGIRQFALAGTSYGALVAACAALAEPARIRKLVLVGSGSVFHPREAQVRTLQAAAANGRKAMENPDFESCRRRLAAIVHTASCIPDALVYAQLNHYALSDRIVEYDRTLAGAIAAAQAPEPGVHERLGELAMPVRIIVGRDDPRADWREHEKAAARIPGARVSVYERCGHLPYLEHAARFDAELLEFLEARP